MKFRTSELTELLYNMDPKQCVQTKHRKFHPKTPDEILAEWGMTFDKTALKWKNEDRAEREFPTESYIKEILGKNYKMLSSHCMALLEYSVSHASIHDGLFFMPITGKELTTIFGDASVACRAKQRLENLGVITYVCKRFMWGAFYGDERVARPQVLYLDEEVAKRYLKLFKKMGAKEGKIYKRYYAYHHPQESENGEAEVSNEVKEAVAKKIEKAGVGKNNCRIKLENGVDELYLRTLAYKVLPKTRELDNLVNEVNDILGYNEYHGSLKVNTNPGRTTATGFSNRPYSNAGCYPKSTRKQYYLENALNTKNIGEYDVKSSIFNLTRAMKYGNGEISLDRDLYEDMIPDIKKETEGDEIKWCIIRNNMKKLALREQFSFYGDGMVKSTYESYEGSLNQLGLSSNWTPAKKKMAIASVFERIKDMVGEGSHDTSIFETEALVYLSVVRDLLKKGKKAILVYDCFYFDRESVSENEIKDLIKHYCRLFYEKYYK